MLQHRIVLVSLLLSTVLTGCKFLPEMPKSSTASQPILTQKAAMARATQVSHISYNQEFFLEKDKTDFSGRVDIAFEWKDTGEPLKVDFFQGTVKKTIFNGKEVNLKYDGQQIVLDARLRKDGVQHLIVEFDRDFDPEGSGLYRFVDNEDHQVYIYSDLEPNFANSVFPCFDQPDLKATFQTKVHVPDEWVVVSNTLPEKIEEREDPESHQITEKIWNFPVSAKMSTYVWSLASGPYKIFEDKSAAYPTRVLVRQTLASQVHTEEWFPVIRQGLKFYNEFFGVNYPYKKMDFVIEPDYNHGGMENVAAITVTESRIKKGPHTRAERARLGSLILHEMAHMWFGDLVTMKWWNDLWLNESFASIMSSVAMSKTSFPQEGWRDFFQGDKRWAYDTDDRVTTHAIQSQVTDTSQAGNQFDGITYGKGASVLKQMMFFIGEDKFRAGLKTYFEKHQGGNAELADFIDALSEASQKPLAHWSERWLKAAGLNTVEMNVTCEGDKIAKAEMIQTATKDHPLLRDQVLQLAVLRGHDKLEAQTTIKVLLSGDHVPIKELKGHKCDSIVFPNYHDHGYAKFRFDSHSLSLVKTSIGKISDPFIRQMSWSMLWSLVIDGEMSVKEFADVWLREFPKETDMQNMIAMSEYAVGEEFDTPSVLMFYPRGRELDTWKKSVDQMLWTEIEKAKPGQERQRILVDAMIALGSQPETLKKLAAMLDGTLKLPHYELDQDRRWLAIQCLARGGFDDVNRRIDEELKQDPSSTGELAALSARVAIPSLDVKKSSFDSITSEEGWNFAQRKTAMKNLFPVGQQELRNELANNFYSQLDQFVGANPKSDFFLKNFMWLAPMEPGNSEKAQLFLSQHTGLPDVVRRSLRELVEFAERYDKALAKAGASRVPAQEQE